MRLLFLILLIFNLASCFNKNDQKLFNVNEQFVLNNEITSSVITNDISPEEKLTNLINHYTEEIFNNPNNSDLYFRRGYLFAFINEYPLDFIQEEIISIFASSTEKWNLAISDWETALRINPNHENAKNYLERARQKRGY